MAILGVMHVAYIWTRVSGAWADSGETWSCRLEPLSPTTVLHGEQFAQTTHIMIGEPTPVIATGNKLVIDGVDYYVNGSQMHDRPGVGNHHQEVYSTRSDT